MSVTLPVMNTILEMYYYYFRLALPSLKFR